MARNATRNSARFIICLLFRRGLVSPLPRDRQSRIALLPQTARFARVERFALRKGGDSTRTEARVKVAERGGLLTLRWQEVRAILHGRMDALAFANRCTRRWFETSFEAP